MAIRDCRKSWFFSFAHYVLAYLSVYHRGSILWSILFLVAFLPGIISGLLLSIDANSYFIIIKRLSDIYLYMISYQEKNT